MSVYNPESITVKVASRTSMDSALDEAVQTLSQRARSSRCGILVTRSGPGDFTVSVDRSVPFGTTLERNNWYT